MPKPFQQFMCGVKCGFCSNTYSYTFNYLTLSFTVWHLAELVRRGTEMLSGVGFKSDNKKVWNSNSSCFCFWGGKYHSIFTKAHSVHITAIVLHYVFVVVLSLLLYEGNMVECVFAHYFK